MMETTPAQTASKPYERWSIFSQCAGFDRPQHVGDAFVGPTNAQVQFNMFAATQEFSFVAFPDDPKQQTFLSASSWKLKSSRKKGSGDKLLRVVGYFDLDGEKGTGKGAVQLYGHITLQRKDT
ncbi:hypothetical protein QEG98_41960 (plasmid) [Myxococcus sp. MxC21-1]|uniref:hypothetical protein n=1 Tax=Myxococcus sp. MxC21-1 TaxID=3041439 RepID=UPI00292D5D0A|nr:hypothetical protein [Myxococcus sp. MxC21-1]WNZ66235.1 hypothetical protein QEG98_41960 [Myxococcus sp. MxC21-1]